MTEPRDSLTQLQYEIMLFTRRHVRPDHTAEPVLDRSGYVLLHRLELSEPMTLKELSQALRLDTSTVHRQVGALLRHNHVAYVPGAAGEVARRISPTDEGLAALARTRATYEEELRDAVGDWPAEKQHQLMALLREFNQNVENAEGTPWPRSAD